MMIPVEVRVRDRRNERRRSRRRWMYGERKSRMGCIVMRIGSVWIDKNVVVVVCLLLRSRGGFRVLSFATAVLRVWVIN